MALVPPPALVLSLFSLPPSLSPSSEEQMKYELLLYFPALQKPFINFF